MKYQVEVPKLYLLTIAVRGDMGSGELPDMMKTWARQECKRLGLWDEFTKMQDENLSEMRERLINILGKDVVDSIEKDIKTAATAFGLVQAAQGKK